MKPTVRAVLFVALVSSCTAFAAGIYVDPCGNPGPFVGDISPVVFCLQGAAGHSTSGAVGAAGRNFFENHIVPVRDVGLLDGGVVVFPHTMTTEPIFDPKVTAVPTHLGLDGEVKLFTNAAFVDFVMTGMLGGPQLTIPLFRVGRPAGTNCPCSIFLNIDRFGKQAPAMTAVQTLTVTINGRARYDAELSPTFEGAVPEPGTWICMVTGLLSLAGVRLRRWLRPT